MAKAPKPGSIRERAAAADAVVLTIKVNTPIEVGGRTIPDEVIVAPALIPIRERTIVRKATGLPISAFWGSDEAIDLDSVVVMWWVGRRLAGESTLTWEQAMDQWPDDLDPDLLEVSVSGDGEDDDEADTPED